MGAKRGTPLERMMRRIETVGECWVWRGFTSPDGYGRMKVAGRCVSVHRLSYELHRGPIPPGKELDHLCRNRACANPEHLEAVSHRVNVLRGDGFYAQAARGVPKSVYTQKRRSA